MKTNLSNYKWIVLPLMLLTFAVGNVRADGSDLSITAPIAADSVVVAPDSMQSTISWSDKFDEVLNNHRFLFGIIASGIAAILVLFVFFAWLRPRLKIMPIVAYHEEKDEKTKLPVRNCQIAIKNKRLFHCNDVRVEVSEYQLSKYDVEIRNQIEEMQYLSIAGCLNSDNLSTINFSFNVKPKVAIKESKKEKEVHLIWPQKIIVEVLAQDALSSIVSPARRIFNITDFQVGTYINTTFGEDGNTFKQAIMKPNMKKLKKVCIILFVLWLTLTIGMVVLPLSILNQLILSLLLFISFILGVVIWQLKVSTKADAYTTESVKSLIKATIIEFHQHRHNHIDSADREEYKEIRPTEDIPFEEVKDEDKNTKKPLK